MEDVEKEMIKKINIKLINGLKKFLNMIFNKIKSYAKINLALNIVGKSKNHYIKLKVLVAFIDLHDEIYIKKN